MDDPVRVAQGMKQGNRRRAAAGEDRCNHVFTMVHGVSACAKCGKTNAEAFGFDPDPIPVAVGKKATETNFQGDVSMGEGTFVVDDKPRVNERLLLLRLWHARKESKPHLWPFWASGFAGALVESATGQSRNTVAVAVHTFVKGCITYVKEPPGRDDWKPSNATLRDAEGDCEDIEIVAAELLHLAGIDSRLLVGRDVRREEDHAILLVSSDVVVYDKLREAELDHRFVLDNLRNRPMRWQDLKGEFEVYCDLPTDFAELQRRIVGDG